MPMAASPEPFPLYSNKALQTTECLYYTFDSINQDAFVQGLTPHYPIKCDVLPPQNIEEAQIFDGYWWTRWTSEHWEVALVAGAFYLVMIVGLKSYMAKREKFRLQNWVICWNFFLSIFSCLRAYETQRTTWIILAGVIFGLSINVKINAFFTRLPFIWCRGGDQTLFIRKEDFLKVGKFREDYQIMEDYEFIIRAKKVLNFKIIPKNVIVSARKYKTNSYLRVQKANFKIMRMFLSGKASQKEMTETYRRMLDYRN
jgi:hypothetical protein